MLLVSWCPPRCRAWRPMSSSRGGPRLCRALGHELFRTSVSCQLCTTHPVIGLAPLTWIEERRARSRSAFLAREESAAVPRLLCEGRCMVDGRCGGRCRAMHRRSCAVLLRIIRERRS